MHLSSTIGATSDVVGEEAFRSAFVVVPILAEGGQVTRRLVREGAHVEELLYRDRRAWYVPVDELREAQRNHALHRFRRPRIDDCLHLARESAMLLSYGLPERPDPTAREGSDDPLVSEPPEPVPAFQWRQKWLREELVRLRTNAALWLAENASFPMRRGVLALDLPQLVMREGALSQWDLAYAVRVCGVVPVLILAGEETQITVAMPEMFPEWIRATPVTKIRNTRTADLPDRNEHTQRMEACIERLWAFLPTSPSVVTHGVGPHSHLYPRPEALKRHPHGGVVMEKWKKDLVAGNKRKPLEGKPKLSRRAAKAAAEFDVYAGDDPWE